MKGKINLELVKLLPRDLQIEIMTNVARKPFTQSELADIQLKLQKEFSQNTDQGKRNDLGRPKNGSTSETPVSEVKRTTQKIGDIFGESHKTVERRLEIFSEINKHPGKYSKVKESLDKGSMKINTANKIVTRKKRSLRHVPLHKGEWDVFVADVPAKYRDEGVRGSAENHYDTISADKLANYWIPPTAENAVMYFCMFPSIMFEKITETKREGGIEFTYEVPYYQYILDHWGFTKITASMFWDKEIIGNGNTVRYEHEIILIATKGKMPLPAEVPPSVIREQRTEHSKKPSQLFEIAKRMYPERKYYSMFDTEERPGWTVHGNQIKPATKPEEKAKPSKKEIVVACADCLEIFRSKDALKAHKKNACPKRKGAKT